MTTSTDYSGRSDAKPGFAGLSAVAASLFVIVGPLGAMGFCTFYIFVFGVTEIGMLTADLLVAFTVIFSLLAALELDLFRKSSGELLF